MFPPQFLMSFASKTHLFWRVRPPSHFSSQNSEKVHFFLDFCAGKGSGFPFPTHFSENSLCATLSDLPHWEVKCSRSKVCTSACTINSYNEPAHNKYGARGLRSSPPLGLSSSPTPPIFRRWFLTALTPPPPSPRKTVSRQVRASRGF